jgi:hypothetical protein
MTHPDVAAWVEEARAAKVLPLAQALGAQLRGGAVEKVGPCPRCGGRDRFGVNLRKNVFYCRQGQAGGDAIALAAYMHGLDLGSAEGFERACEIVTGRPRPGGGGLSESDRAELARRREAAAAEARAREAQRAKTESWYRERAQRRAAAEWRAAQSARGTPAEAYLLKRGLTLPAAARLRYAPELPYFVGERGRPLFKGPAMVAAITTGAGDLIGLHRTWIDLDAPSGKRTIADPTTGEILPAKKVLGSKSGGRIVLAAPEGPPTRLFVGEGIETVLSVREALIAAGSALLEGAMFWSSVDLGNLAGKATARVRHPTLTTTDKAGRVRPVQVAGPEPDMGAPALTIPESVRELVMLQDGDSEPFMTRNAMLRAARRYRRPGLVIRCAAAPEGGDFNDLWRAELSAEDAG